MDQNNTAKSSYKQKSQQFREAIRQFKNNKPQQTVSMSQFDDAPIKTDQLPFSEKLQKELDSHSNRTCIQESTTQCIVCNRHFSNEVYEKHEKICLQKKEKTSKQKLQELIDKAVEQNLSQYQYDQMLLERKQCQSCSRNFNAKSYEKHIKYCQKSQQKRKEFQSQEQRITDEMQEAQNQKDKIKIFYMNDIRPCKFCNRKFNDKSHQKHEIVCEKVNRKRQTFDTKEQRKSYQMQQFDRKIQEENKQNSPQSNNNQKQQCQTCQRSFNSTISLNKHSKLCQKKRPVFDSKRQRIFHNLVNQADSSQPQQQQEDYSVKDDDFKKELTQKLQKQQQLKEVLYQQTAIQRLDKLKNRVKEIRYENKQDLKSCLNSQNNRQGNDLDEKVVRGSEDSKQFIEYEPIAENINNLHRIFPMKLQIQILQEYQKSKKPNTLVDFEDLKWLQNAKFAQKIVKFEVLQNLCYPVLLQYFNYYFNEDCVRDSSKIIGRNVLYQVLFWDLSQRYYLYKIAFKHSQQSEQNYIIENIMKKLSDIKLQSKKEQEDLTFILFILQNYGLQQFKMNMRDFIQILCKCFEKGSIQIRDTINTIFLEIYFQVGQLCLPYIEEINKSVYKRLKIRFPDYIKVKQNQLKKCIYPNNKFQKPLKVYQNIDEMKQFDRNIFTYENEGEKEVNKFWIEDAIIYQIIKNDNQFAEKIITCVKQNPFSNDLDRSELWNTLLEFINNPAPIIQEMSIKALQFYIRKIGQILAPQSYNIYESQALVLIKPLLEKLQMRHAQETVYSLYNSSLIRLENLIQQILEQLKQENSEEYLITIYNTLNQIFSRAQSNFINGSQFQLVPQFKDLLNFLFKNLHSNIDIRVRQQQLLSYMIFVFQKDSQLQDVIQPYLEEGSIQSNIKQFKSNIEKVFYRQTIQEQQQGDERQLGTVVQKQIQEWKQNLAIIFK